MAKDVANLLALRALRGGPLVSQPGASSFFAPPNKELDPHLFLKGGTRLWPDVRNWITQTIYQFWADKYLHARTWSEIWIAGSGATYQWDAARSVGEPGDLDILIGVDFPEFWRVNSKFLGFGETAQAEYFNNEFRSMLNPSTSHSNINGQLYEVTFYVNPGGTDIRDINPYAAYDVSWDRWTVKPPALAPDWDPMRELPQSWWDSFDEDHTTAIHIIGDVNYYADALRSTQHSDPHWLNIATQLHDSIYAGAGLFDEIHSKRHDSFQPGGGGYTGYSNVRWQAGKREGFLHTLHTLKDMWTSAHATVEANDYGKHIIDPSHALVIAALVGSSGQG